MHPVVQECGVPILIRCAVLMGPVARVRWVEHQVLWAAHQVVVPWVVLHSLEWPHPVLWRECQVHLEVLRVCRVKWPGHRACREAPQERLVVLQE